MAAYIELSFEDIRRLSGKRRKNMSCFLRGFPSKPYPLQLFFTKSVNVYKPSPTTGRTNADGGFPSRVYSFFGFHPAAPAHHLWPYRSTTISVMDMGTKMCVDPGGNLFQENKSYDSKKPFAFILWWTRKSCRAQLGLLY
jgi:hypothetical protein